MNRLLYFPVPRWLPNPTNTTLEVEVPVRNPPFITSTTSTRELRCFERSLRETPTPRTRGYWERLLCRADYLPTCSVSPSRVAQRATLSALVLSNLIVVLNMLRHRLGTLRITTPGLDLLSHTKLINLSHAPFRRSLLRLMVLHRHAVSVTLTIRLLLVLLLSESRPFESSSLGLSLSLLLLWNGLMLL